MEVSPDAPLLGEPTLPPREGLHKLLIYGLLLGLGVAFFVLLLWAVQVWLNPASPPPPPGVSPPAPALQTPPLPLDSLMREAYPTSFANQDRRPAIPEAQLVQDIPPPPPTAPPVTKTAPAPPLGDKQPAAPPAKADAKPTATPDPKPAAQDKPKKPAWGFLATGTSRPPPPAPPNEPGSATKGAHLIDPGVWAIPAKPERTLYRTQVLPCEVLAKIDTDAPGQIQLGLTVPVFGFYGKGDELFPKGSRVIGVQAGKAEYGQKTIGVKLEQVHLLNGTIVEIPGEVGNEDGSNQLKGKTNNHWGTVFLGAAANALVSLGGGYLTGTPGKNQYFEDPAQRAMTEASQSIQADTKTIIGREIKRAPTITRDPHRKDERFCTIQILKNIQFSAKPLVVHQEGGKP